jgi:hypothetical protein
MSTDKTIKPRTHVSVDVRITTTNYPGTNTYGEQIGTVTTSEESFTIGGESLGQAISKAHAFLTVLDPIKETNKS